MKRPSTLPDLFTALFDSVELGAFIRKLPDGAAVYNAMSWHGGHMAACTELAAHLERRGEVGPGLRALLLSERPRRAADIDLAFTSIAWAAVPLQSLIALDIQTYLTRLLREVDHINITGIRSRSGASRDALRRPIEDLYTKLQSRPTLQTRSDGPGVGERVELPEILCKHHRILLDGAPGSGKSTFINLVACMLARDLAEEVPPPVDAASWRAKYLGLTGPARVPAVVRIAQLAALLARNAVDGRGDGRRWLLHLLALRACPEAGLELDLRGIEHSQRCAQWDALLSAGDAFLLLDGLDEASDPALRERIFLIVRDACHAWKNSQILVTSRPLQTEAVQRMGFHRAAIAPFAEPEIERYVRQWSRALHEGHEPESGKDIAVPLLAAIHGRRDLRELATNPVMLTCLCVVHWNEGGLPEGRARVYHAVFFWMLRSREEIRCAAGYTSEFATYAFPNLALAMMGPAGKRAQVDLWAAAEALDGDVAREFPTVTNRKRWARDWLIGECEWSHIIEEVEGDQLRFWHLTMQEYAAALALAQRRDGADDPARDWWPIVREHLAEPQWRQTIAMLPGCLYDEGGRTRVDRFAELVLALGDGDHASPLMVAHCVGALGRVIEAMRSYRYRFEPALSGQVRALMERALIVSTSQAEVIPADARIAVAVALELAGFPHPENSFLPLPGRGVSLGRFPVTVAEYAAFVGEGGYADDTCWGTEGMRLRTRYGWQEPDFWDLQRHRPNQPVVGVSWFEARAYCQWLQRRIGGTVRLPLAAEWEFAATPDGRKFPWGDEEPTPERANYRDVGEPTPVGVYPSGAGMFGHEELAGNVWEWCEDGEPESNPAFYEMYGDVQWVKGGSWYSDGDLDPIAYRGRNGAGGRLGGIGFRVLVGPAP